MTDRTVTRLRREPALKLLDVSGVEQSGPRLVRVTLGGSQLSGFHSPSFDDHVKVFFPAERAAFRLVPERGPNGPVFDPSLPRPSMRDDTPHGYDAKTLSMRLDFSLHASGPATAWARRARPGDRLLVGGPRASFIIGGFDWYLLAGDDTALPAIRRRLAELPPTTRALVFIEVESAEDRQLLPSQAATDVCWLHRTNTAPPGRALIDAIVDAELPAGAFHAWVAVNPAWRKHCAPRCSQRALTRLR